MVAITSAVGSHHTSIGVGNIDLLKGCTDAVRLVHIAASKSQLYLDIRCHLVHVGWRRQRHHNGAGDLDDWHVTLNLL